MILRRFFLADGNRSDDFDGTFRKNNCPFAGISLCVIHDITDLFSCIGIYKCLLCRSDSNLSVEHIIPSYPALYSYCKYTNEASIRTAESIGMQFDREYPDEEHSYPALFRAAIWGLFFHIDEKWQGLFLGLLLYIFSLAIGASDSYNIRFVELFSNRPT